MNTNQVVTFMWYYYNFRDVSANPLTRAAIAVCIQEPANQNLYVAGLCDGVDLGRHFIGKHIEPSLN